MSGNVDVSNHVQLLVAATIYLHVDQPESALRVLKLSSRTFSLIIQWINSTQVLHPSNHLECSAMKVQSLLALNRPDLARKELKSMQEKDEDATVTQLAQAWTNMATGGEKIQEAYYIYQVKAWSVLMRENFDFWAHIAFNCLTDFDFDWIINQNIFLTISGDSQEMIDKLGGTALLLNGQAVTFIAQGKYAEAETALGEALEKDPNNPETLVNLVVLAQHQGGKSQEQATRLLSQLKDLEPGHPFLQVSS